MPASCSGILNYAVPSMIGATASLKLPTTPVAGSNPITRTS